MNYSDDLYRFILKNVENADDAKDIVQNSFEILWIKKEEVEKEKAKSYLFTIGYRKMIDEYRRTKKIKLTEQMPEHFAGKTEIKNFDIKRSIDNALNKLPAIQKQLVLLKDYEGYNYEELAKITGLNESQVKVYLYRARVSLKNELVSIENTL